MPAKIENALTNTLGFSSEYFVRHHAKTDDYVAIEQLTKEDLFKLIHEQKLSIQSWKEFGFRNSDYLKKYIDDNSALIRMNMKLMEDNDKLRAGMRELRKQLKKEE
jgi:hypothetical protein